MKKRIFLAMDLFATGILISGTAIFIFMFPYNLLPEIIRGLIDLYAAHKDGLNNK
jgi:hypothetical protein